MESETLSSESEETIEVDLREPRVAACLAWLWPGAGHLYQRRYGKGFLFMVCILGTYFFGLALGGGHVVYASWKKNDRRWQYFCQVAVGAPALPAVVQTLRVKSGKTPLFVEGYYTAESDTLTEIEPAMVDEQNSLVYVEAPMAPPGHVSPQSMDLLAKWHEEYHSFFELGTLFTVIAGLLNVLAVYDAFAGPAASMPDPKKDESPPEDDEKKKKN